MPNPIVNRRVVLKPRAINGSYDPEAEALFTRMSVQPNAARKQAISDFFIGVKSDESVVSIASILDCLWFFAAHDQQAARLNWVKNAHDITEVNSPTWTLNRGYTGDNATTYLNSNYNPSTQAVNYTLNSNSFGVYSRTNSAANDIDIGSYMSGTNRSAYFYAKLTDNNFYMYNNSAPTDSAIAATDSLSLIVSQRTTSNLSAYYRRGVSIGTSAVVSSGIPNGNWFIMARNTDGAPGTFSGREYSMAFSGKVLNQLSFYDRVQTFLITVGANV